MAGQKRHQQGPYQHNSRNTVDMRRESLDPQAMRGGQDWHGAGGRREQADGWSGRDGGPAPHSDRGYQGGNDYADRAGYGRVSEERWAHEGTGPMPGASPVDGQWAPDDRGRSAAPRAGAYPSNGRGQGRARTDGPHAGKGPRGYRRADARIEEEINDMLTRHPEIDAGEIEVSVSNGEVTLSGTVDSRRTRHAVEALVEDCAGVGDIENRLRIAEH